ncbi:threonine synthase [Maricaulis sp.]|uniref:threonine synthase n=1 Tax=Maricaulis sp. TaxID=1486257 RepID=UPI00260394FF|nr:threonine synthase [Maricaulis sp.]
MYRNYFTHLECSATGTHYDKDQPQNLSEAGKPLLARYDFERAKGEIDRDEIAAREGGFWKWRELLPVRDDKDVCALGELDTPMIDVPATARASGATGKVWVKDEGRLPTGSFKARGLGLAVAMAHSFGIKRMAMPTNGNAGAALSAYCSRMGMESYCFAPEDTPEVNLREMARQGAKVFKVNGYIHHCGALVGAGKAEMGWFDVSTLKEPYRIEGKKTMGVELAMQMGWTLPDAIFYPTGGGTGLIGMWKAFDEMERLSWIGSERPKMIAVQAEGCAPIVRAWDKGETHAEEWLEADTHAMGIRVPKAIGDFLILEACRDSGGFAMSVSEDEIQAARVTCAQEDGLLLCPEGAATLAAMEKAMANGQIERDAECVLFNCGSGLKYDMPEGAKPLDRHGEIDWGSLK